MNDDGISQATIQPSHSLLPSSLGGSDKESTCNVGDLDLIAGLGRSPGEGNSYPLQYSGLEYSLDCVVHGRCKESDTTEQSSLHCGLPGWC